MSVDLTRRLCGRENRTNAHIIDSNCRLIHGAVSFLRWAFPLSHLPPAVTASRLPGIGSGRARLPKKS